MVKSARKSKPEWFKGRLIANEGKIEITLPYLSCSEPKDRFEDYTRYEIDVRCEDMVEFPMDGNPRGLDVTSQSFRDVCDTLKRASNCLHDNNHGGDIFANYVKVDRNAKTITFTFMDTCLGIINGATTLGAILYMKYLGELQPGHEISYRVRDYNTDKLTHAQRMRILENANNLNSCKEQNLENMCYQLGYFNSFIDRLDDTYKRMFIFKSDTNESEYLDKMYKSNMLIRLCAGMDFMRFPINEDAAPTYTNKGSVGLMKSFDTAMKNDEDPFGYLMPMLNSFVELFGFIQYNWYKGLKLDKEGSYHRKIYNAIVNTKTEGKPVRTPYTYMNPSEYQATSALRADAFLWILYCSFRANLYFDPVKREVGWRVPFAVVWEKCHIDLLDKIYRTLKDFNPKGDEEGFINDIPTFLSKVDWNGFCRIVDSAVESILDERAEREAKMSDPSVA